MEDFFRACLEGRKLGPQTYFDLAQWLSGRSELGQVTPGAVKSKATLKAKKAGPLRLLYVTGVFPSLKHGGGLRTFDIMRGLAARGHEVSLYSVHEPGDEAELKEMAFLKTARLAANTDTFSSGFAGWLAGQKDFDAIHFIWPQAAELMATARPRTRRMVFEYIESVSRAAAINLLREIQSRDFSGKAVFQLLEAFHLESRGTALADATISLTPEDHAFTVHSFRSDKDVVIPTGISDYAIWEKAAQAGAPPKNRDALFLGFFTHTPNQVGVRWYLEHVHPQVLAAVPDYRFVLAGAGAPDVMREIVKDHAGVTYEGPFDSVVERVASCRIGLAPLITGAGLRGKVNQYSAVGRPTVSTSLGTAGLPYVHGESVMIADEPRAFATAIIQLLNDETAYETVRAGAERMAREHYNWKKYLPELETIYAG